MQSLLCQEGQTTQSRKRVADPRRLVNMKPRCRKKLLVIWIPTVPSPKRTLYPQTCEAKHTMLATDIM
jgi:hypothetical protein